ncbi:MAG TPA: hypothetical protein DCO77_07760 [Nitrospiraceae bacterium]|nr:hypothetical protein [Nitrospiraceae bacterium]
MDITFKKKRTILVTGATGHQGGAVARSLLEAGWNVRALVRDPSKPAAGALKAKGVEVVTGDLDDKSSVDKALEGAYGAFGVFDFWQNGLQGEIRKGKSFADACTAAGIEHYIYSSVGGAERKTGVPHFDSKYEIEEYIQDIGLSATIFRPVFLMYNFEVPETRKGIGEGTLSYALRPERKIQMLAVEDLGAFVAMAFERPEEYIGKAIELAGDELTMPQVADVFTKATGRAVTYIEQSIDDLRKYSEEMAIMFEWFNKKGYEADIPALRKLYPPLMTLEVWLHKTGWGKKAA